MREVTFTFRDWPLRSNRSADGRETGSASHEYSMNVARPFIYWSTMVGSKPITLRSSRLHKTIPEYESCRGIYPLRHTLHQRLSRDNASRRIMRASGNGEQSADKTYTFVKLLTECSLNKTLARCSVMQSRFCDYGNLSFAINEKAWTLLQWPFKMFARFQWFKSIQLYLLRLLYTYQQRLV